MFDDAFKAAYITYCNAWANTLANVSDVCDYRIVSDNNNEHLLFAVAMAIGVNDALLFQYFIGTDAKDNNAKLRDFIDFKNEVLHKIETNK